jgi:hypothetical protein
MTNSRWTTIYVAAAGFSLAVLAFLIWATPRTEEGASPGPSR